ncbi:MAG TPA: flavin reductase family protein [Methanomassiliicoccaceae archaeon]|nr:flavin reductase family protein [Methanomassiliicoccaceae archaeon]
MGKKSIGARPYMAAMPAVLVGANVDGRPNFMTVAWAGVACMEPAMVSISVNKNRYTEKGITENRTFSINIPSSKDAVLTDYCGMVSGRKEDKSELFDVFYGKLSSAPLIRTFPVNIECELYHTADLGSHNLHVGKVIDIHVDEDCITDGMPDPAKVDPLVYSNGSYYLLGELVGKAYSLGARR